MTVQGILVFSVIMATLGLQVIYQSVRELLSSVSCSRNILKHRTVFLMISRVGLCDCYSNTLGLFFFSCSLLVLFYYIRWMCFHDETLIWQGPHNMDLRGAEFPWVVGIMAGTSVVKLGLMLSCWTFKIDGVRTCGKDHMFDVITNVLGLGAALLATWFYWWIDPTGCIIVRAPSNLFS